MLWWIGLGAVSLAVEPTGDTGVPAGDTAVEVVDTGSSVEPARSASELAGEEGGCRCTSSTGALPGLGALLVIVAVARRRT